MKTKQSILKKYLKRLIPFKNGEFSLPITYNELEHYLKSTCVEDLPLIYINGGGLKENPIKYGLIKTDKNFMIWQVGTGPLATLIFTTINLKTKSTKHGLSINWHVRNNLFGNLITLFMLVAFIAGTLSFFQSGMNLIDWILPIAGFFGFLMFLALFNSDYNDNIEFLESIQKKFKTP